MANHKSAKKRIRQTVRRTIVNRNRLGRIRSFLRGVEEAIAGGDQTKARAALSVAEPEMARGARRGILPRNTVARKVSRLNSRIKAMPA